MLVVGVQAGAVDGLLRSHVRVVGTGGGSDNAGDRIRVRLDREGPDAPFEDGAVRRGVDLVDPPVVRLPEFKAPQWLVRIGVLARADQHALGIGPARGVHVVERSPEVDVMRGGVDSRAPPQGDAPRHIGGVIHRARGRGQLERGALHQSRDLLGRQDPVEYLDIVDDGRGTIGDGDVGDRLIPEARVRIEVGKATQVRAPGHLFAVEVQNRRPPAELPRHRHVEPCIGSDRSRRGDLDVLEIRIGRVFQVEAEVLRTHVGVVGPLADEEVDGAGAGVEEPVVGGGRAVPIGLEPERQRAGLRENVGDRDVGLGSITVDTAAVQAGCERGAAAEAGVVALAARVDRHCPAGLIEPPPADQARIGGPPARGGPEQDCAQHR